MQLNVCFDFARSFCHFGNICRFVHDSSARVNNPSIWQNQQTNTFVGHALGTNTKFANNGSGSFQSNVGQASFNAHMEQPNVTSHMNQAQILSILQAKYQMLEHITQYLGQAQHAPGFGSPTQFLGQA